jgi:hypothetical protein
MWWSELLIQQDHIESPSGDLVYRTHGAAVAREIPVFSGQPQGHPFKSGWVHQK